MKVINIILLISILTLVIVGLIIPTQNNSPREEVIFVSENLTIKDFLLKDQTDKNEYIVGEYVCLDFSRDVIKNAREYGFEVYEVGVHWEGYGNVTHSIIVFIVNGQFIHADVTQTDAWVSINFSTGDYKTYDIRTGQLTRAEKIDWYFINAGK